MDFSKPVNSSQNSIDITTDTITTDIRLPGAMYGGALFISDGVMHLRPAAFGTFLTTVLNFNLKTQIFDVLDSGQQQARSAAIAFDTEQQVGWYYGGIVESDAGLIYSQDLYRLDRGKGTPTKVEVSSSVGAVFGGELVYIKNIGEAGILVLIGGTTGSDGTQMVSMVDLN